MRLFSKTDSSGGTDSFPTVEHKQILRGLAIRSIEHGLQFSQPFPVNVREHPLALQVSRAVFVTLRNQDELRGCIGTLHASEPVVSAVAKYAFAAAFRDTRFHEITGDELSELNIQISILSEPEPLAFDSEKELAAQLRPGIDGLVLKEWPGEGTLLPSVWEEIPDRFEFLARLKQKAGFAPDYWSENLQVLRYTATCFS